METRELGKVSIGDELETPTPLDWQRVQVDGLDEDLGLIHYIPTDGKGSGGWKAPWQFRRA